MKIVTKSNLIEALENMELNEVMYLKTPQNLEGGLNLMLDMITTVEHLFQTSIKSTDANYDVIKKIMSDYGDAVSTFFSAIYAYIKEIGTEEALEACERKGISINYSKVLGYITFTRNKCIICDKKTCVNYVE